MKLQFLSYSSNLIDFAIRPRNKVGSILATGSILQSGSADSNKELSAKEKRMLKMLSEDLVDPDKLLSVASNKRQK